MWFRSIISKVHSPHLFKVGPLIPTLSHVDYIIARDHLGIWASQGTQGRAQLYSVIKKRQGKDIRQVVASLA
ncbi:hypothetical protein VN97_g8655 [Penicillium thymicola]|uniref:Uncharacterized protein n=1 Tax=Penicillium thymicola TaxID=293382 RepID=A0AAI9TCV1_PENTH|nr:hypothetical protein VN97_g8655 [Penicillium thymicola]